MTVDAHNPPGLLAGPRPASSPGPQWRALLESRWRARLREVTELSLAYHDAAAAVPATSGQSRDVRAGRRQLWRLLNRAVTARRALADTEEALARLSAGRFGCCENCTAAIPAAQLALTPEARYCPPCAVEAICAAPALPGGSG